MEVADEHCVRGQGAAQDAAAKRALPPLQLDANGQQDEAGGVDVQIVGPDLAQDHEHEERRRHPWRGVSADHREHSLLGREAGVDRGQEQTEDAQQDHRQHHPGRGPE